MTITAVSPRKAYVASGASAVFTIPFKFANASDVLVYYNSTPIVIGFSITGAGDINGGVCTFTAIPPNGTTILFLRATARAQTTAWNPNDPDPAEAKENAFDKSMSIDQEEDETFARTPHYRPQFNGGGSQIDDPVTGQFLRHKDNLGNVDSAVPALGAGLSNPVSFAQGGTSGNYGNASALAAGLALARWASMGTLTPVAGVLTIPNPITGNRFDVGAGAISSITNTGVPVGAVLYLRYHTGGNVITSSAALLMLGAIDFTTSVDDLSIFQYDGTNWNEIDRIIATVAFNAGRFRRGDGNLASPNLSRVMGLIGVNNAGTPNSQYDLSAAGIVFYNPSDGAVFVKNNQTVLTNNVLTAGPAANGRDQAGVFGTNVWIHEYFIIKRDGTVATLSSLIPPPVGPTLPATYIAWAYCGAVRYNVTPVLVKTHMRGAQAFYEAVQGVLITGAAVVETAVSVAAFVPPNALKYTIVNEPTGGITFQADGAGLLDVSLKLRIVTGADWRVIRGFHNGAGISKFVIWPLQDIVMPNIGQQFFYLIVIVNATSAITNLACAGYTMPNGGE